MRALVTGANRGIGFEMVTQLVMRGDQVFAACRAPDLAPELYQLADRFPDRLRLVALDVSSEDSIRECAEEVSAQTNALDLLVNNAAIVDRGETLDTLNMNDLVEMFKINTFGPLLMAKYHLELLKRGSTPFMVSITSEYGSLTDKSDGDLYNYCGSKAALNMMTRTFHFDAARFGIGALIMDPGWVRTRMGGWDADLSPEESVSGMLRVFDAARNNPRAYSGRYWRWNGDEMAW